MTKYVVYYIDAETNARSEIDTFIKDIDNYDASDYIDDCKANADNDWNDMLSKGTVEVEPVYDEVLILMNDNISKENAQTLLDPSYAESATIYDSIDEYIETLKANNCYDDETPEGIRNGKYPHISAVNYGGHEYCIEYAV